jgi:chemotaxis signal transduction protein
MPAARGGVVLRIDGELRYVPASVAVKVAPRPRVTPVPGAPRELDGIAMYEGTVVPIVNLGATGSEMVVCQYAGELLGLVGGEVVRTGTFEMAEGSPGLVEWEGKRIPPLDIAALYARVQSATRVGRWG